MIQRVRDNFAVHVPQEAARFLRLFEYVLSDDRYKALIMEQLGMANNYAQRKVLLEHYHFTMPDLCTLLVGIDPGKTGIALLGRQHVVRKYTPSVPAIVVDKNGVERVGTGFLVHNHYSGTHFNGNGFIVTAKHNIDPSEKIRFLRFESPSAVQFTALADDWICHPDLDMAAIPIATAPELIPIYPLGDAGILSRTISMGFPSVATTDGLYLLAHNGELNAIITSYLDKKEYLVISNNVSPGSSGGPVLEDSGLCIGMVIRALETEHEGGRTKTNAAIPAGEIQRFLQTLRLP
jgi:S1-C subfamily serine protease